MSATAFVRQKLQLLIAPRNFEACRMRTLAQAPAQSVLSAGLDLQQNLPEGGFVGSEHRWWPCVERRCWSRKNVLHLVGHLRTLFHHDRQRTERHLLNLFILPTSREEFIEKMDWSRSHSVCSFYRHWFWAPLQEYVSCAHFSPNRHDRYASRSSISGSYMQIEDALCAAPGHSVRSDLSTQRATLAWAFLDICKNKEICTQTFQKNRRK